MTVRNPQGHDQPCPMPHQCPNPWVEHGTPEH